MARARQISRVKARLVLAEALIHSLGGLDEEGVAALYEADDIAHANGDRTAVAQARAELGYVDFLRARYERAEMWLTDALRFADDSLSILAKATTYLGSVESDRADYVKAADLLEEGIDLSRAAGDPRREAYGLSMLGRLEPAPPRPRHRRRATRRVHRPRRRRALAGDPAVAPGIAGGGAVGPQRPGGGRRASPSGLRQSLPARRSLLGRIVGARSGHGRRGHRRDRTRLRGPCRRPGPMQPTRPTLTSGSTVTFSTHNVNWVCDTAIPTPNFGLRRCESLHRERE